jgi:hypothetical protein
MKGNTAMTTDPGNDPSEFASVLLQHAKGRAHDEATDKLKEAVEAVKKFGVSATVTVSFKVHPVKNNSTVVKLEDTVTAKIPTEPRSSMWFPDEQGALHRNQPGLYGDVDADTIPADTKSAAAGKDN